MLVYRKGCLALAMTTSSFILFRPFFHVEGQEVDTDDTMQFDADLGVLDNITIFGATNTYDQDLGLDGGMNERNDTMKFDADLGVFDNIDGTTNTYDKDLGFDDDDGDDDGDDGRGGSSDDDDA